MEAIQDANLFDNGIVPKLPALPEPATIKGEPAGTATNPDDDHFDWDDGDVILHEQPLTAVYWNAAGSLTIRQRHRSDEDSIIVISPDCLDDFLDRLTDRCGIPSVGR